MVALFSSLASSANAETASSSSIPTVIQLYTSTPILLDQTKLAGHAILSYQAVQVQATSEQEKETNALFGRTSRKATSSSVLAEAPNLGVWSAKVSTGKRTTSNSGSTALVDSLLKIPSSPYYVMTVDLSNPSQVEPAMTRMQEALVRYLIACPPKSSSYSTRPPLSSATSLYDLQSVTFGLAPQDSSTTTAAPSESDRNVCIHLVICALVPSQTKDDYVETQAQHLVAYHLRRFAFAINATLCFCAGGSATTSTTVASSAAAEANDEEHENKENDKQETLSRQQVAMLWRDFAMGQSLAKDDGEGDKDGVDDKESQRPTTAVHVPDKNPELIETVLLRNANCPPNWDASTDSLWKALPVEDDNPADGSADGQPTATPGTTTGDSGWLQQLRDSLGTAATAGSSSNSTEQSTPSSSKKDDADVSSFFENLLKK